LLCAHVGEVAETDEGDGKRTETSSGHAAKGPCTDEVAYVLDEELRKLGRGETAAREAGAQ
jgi:hypothetical protein